MSNRRSRAASLIPSSAGLRPALANSCAITCNPRMIRGSLVLGLLATITVAQESPVPTSAPVPTWEQLDARAVPQWFDDAKFGIFIHWGVYSVPAICDTSTYSEWYQYWLDTNSHGGLVKQFHDKWYGEEFEYRQFAEQFRCELWDPAEWARIFKRAGADYIVITSKHHDGFCLWPDQQASRVRGYAWNAVDTGPERDLLGELAAAVREQGVRFGLYYSFLEWHNPLFARSIPDYVEQQMFPQIKDLIARYRPSVFWPDGEWNHPDSSWRSRELLHWLREHAPNSEELVVNDRWGKGCRGENGDYYTTEYGNYGGSKTHLGLKPFEECRGIGHSFAFNRLENYDVYLSRTECVRTLIDLVSRGGKLLLDIGPDADGTIPLIMTDRLLAIGRWLERNGESIHGCDKSPFRATPWGRATTNDDVVYLQVYDWPEDGRLSVPGIASGLSRAWMLRDGEDRPLSYDRGAAGVLTIDLRDRHPDEHASVIALRLDGPLAVDERFLPDERGAVTLAAATAAIEGRSLRLEQQGNLGYWSNTGDKATWPQVAVQPGVDYSVILDYAILPGEEGGTLQVDVGGTVLEKQLRAPTQGWQDYRQEAAWDFASDGSSVVDVVVRAKKIANSALCNLRAIRLVPKSEPPAKATGPGSAGLRGAVQAECAAMCASLRRGDWSAVASVYADDAVMVRAGSEPVTGRAAIDACWRDLGRTARDWQLETFEVRVAGAVAHQLGLSTLATVRDGNPQTLRLLFARTWLRAADGRLRIVSDVQWTPPD